MIKKVVVNKRAIGSKGEEMAISWLLENQFGIIRQNYYTPYGEIDIIATKDHIVYFIEVKYRRSLNFGTAKEALTRQKINHIKKSVLHYITSQKEYIDYRISFIGIYDLKDRFDIEWIENIFE